jgi:hypothetical protein
MSSILFVKVYMWNKKIIFHIQMMLEVAYLKHNYLKEKKIDRSKCNTNNYKERWLHTE